VRRAAFLLMLCSPASATELKFDKDTAIIIWRCGQIVEANRISGQMGGKVDPIPDYCLSIGTSIGEIPVKGNGDGK
jgi:hypothetical protein